MVFDEIIFCLHICGSIRSQIPPATAVGEAWAVSLIPPHMLEVVWVQWLFPPAGKAFTMGSELPLHRDMYSVVRLQHYYGYLYHLGKHLHVRVYLLLPFLMLMPASVLGVWGFFMGSEHSPIIGTAVSQWAFQWSRKAFMCRSRAAANPSQSCTKMHSYFCGCSSTIGSHANLGSTRACVQCCHGRVGDRNEFIVHAMTSINLRIIILSERSQ